MTIFTRALPPHPIRTSGSCSARPVLPRPSADCQYRRRAPSGARPYRDKNRDRNNWYAVKTELAEVVAWQTPAPSACRRKNRGSRFPPQRDPSRDEGERISWKEFRGESAADEE